MSASNSNTNNNSTTSISNRISMSTVLGFLTSLPATIVCGMIAISLWFGVFAKTSTVMSNGVSWSSIRGQVAKVISSSMIAMFLLMIASLIYFLQDQTKSIYVVFIMISISAALSYSAMAASTAN